ncbi:oligopeptide/dipeptide ABC transporter ATP-binding protein [Ornithinimicrobium faecis]|uniref:oligopeptide/dipeptide ABC transporter ATP-binding protein n=1 Tax=Ornithinimicrobium faecis TaxID=2934158 RepID=UPI002118C4D1|nr:ABC transporter ATP-binding protein [Ornithinimicrobium sp. HY1745]
MSAAPPDLVTSAPPVVEVVDLVKHFPVGRPPLLARMRRGAEQPQSVVHAIDGVRLEVSRGEALAIVGESGCGKSTVAKVLVGLLQPDTGRAAVAGHQIPLVGARDRAARRRVQIVSQSPWSALNRAKTIRHIVTQPLRVHGLVRGRKALEQRATELMEMVGLSAEYLDRKPLDISGGELQRITIARALAGEPEVLVLDEPTASLDVSVKAILVNLLSDLRRELGLSYVLITHELDIARHLADRVAVMYLGEFVEVGPVDQVFARPDHPYTRSLLAAAPSMDTLGRPPEIALRGEVPSAVDVPPGCRFHTRCPFATPSCREQRPQLEPRGEDRAVACLRINELPAHGLAEEESAP